MTSRLPKHDGCCLAKILKYLVLPSPGVSQPLWEEHHSLTNYEDSESTGDNNHGNRQRHQL